MINLTHLTSFGLELSFLDPLLSLYWFFFLCISMFSALYSPVYHVMELVGHHFFSLIRVLPLKRAAEEKAQAIRQAAASSFKSMLHDRGDITKSSRWSRVGAIVKFIDCMCKCVDCLVVQWTGKWPLKLDLRAEEVGRGYVTDPRFES